MALISIWTDARIEHLKADYAEGYSCAQIAARIGEGVTRNAVIGKLHRLGLDKPLNVKTRPGVRAPRESGPRKQTSRQRVIHGTSRFYEAVSNPTEIKLRCVEIVPRNLTLIDLEPGDCRYPYGDGPMTFCGHPKMEGSSYCVPHNALCWVKPIVTAPKARVYHGTDFARGAA